MHRFVGLLAGVAVLLGSVAVASSGGATQAQARWVITDLGTLGGKQSGVNDINERGQIVGMSETSTGSYHAFLWQGGRMRDLGTLGGSDSAAWGINERGQVVGWASTTSGTLHGFLWENGQMRDIGTLPGYRDSAAGMVNERGQVVGIGMNRYLQQGVPADQRAFLWENGEVRDLGKLPDYGYATFVGLNDRGQVAGTGFDTLDDQNPGSMLDGQAFLWASGSLRPLATPGESARSEAVGINARGQVIGVLSRVGRRWETWSVLWEAGQVRDLGSLGGKWSRPFDVNGRGQVVGWAATGRTARSHCLPVMHAYLWQNGRMLDLGTLGGEHSLATSINDRAQVVGWANTRTSAVTGNSTTHAFLWQDGTMTDLGALGDTFPESTAFAINMHNQILGGVRSPTSQAQRAVLWTLKR